jgi:hypothetical protein
MYNLEFNWSYLVPYLISAQYKEYIENTVITQTKITQ